MPYLCDTTAQGGVLCTFSTRTSATAAGFASSSQLSSSQSIRFIREGGIWTVHHNTNLTLLHGLLSVLGHLSSLRPHAALSSFVVNYSWLLFVYYFRCFAKRILPLSVPCGEMHAVIWIFITLYFRKFPLP